jgi:4-hydroxybenzoyl-CoA thioesterase
LPVPRWEPVVDEDRRLDAHARELIELREHIVPIPASLTLEA